MPHQCVRCNKFYDDGSNEILTGCTCGGKMFFFVRKEAVEKAKEIVVTLSKEDKKQIEEDVYDLIGEEKQETPVVLDFESIRVLKPGKFEIDLVSLFKKEPLIYRMGDGKYMIDIASVFDAELKKPIKNAASKKKSAKDKAAKKKATDKKKPSKK